MSRSQLATHKDADLKPRILVIGVGGAGGNAVNNMINSQLEGVEFVVMNTDAQALKNSLASTRIQLGPNITQGLGAGAKPDVGKAAAEETIEDILEPFRGSNMVFIAAGMGGGTGTGAAPVIAKTARELGILTIGVVTKPFQFEGAHRSRIAEQGISELQQFVDTLIVIPNQNLFRIANERTTFADAFTLADDVLYSGVRGITDLMIMPGLINLDFADVRAVMGEKGKAMMGTGEAQGDRRALQAAEAAISNPLLDDVSMKGARGVLINITGGYDMTLYEVDEAANRIREEVDPEANIIFGSTFDAAMDGTMRVSIVATGIDAHLSQQFTPPARPMVSTVASAPRFEAADSRPISTASDSVLPASHGATDSVKEFSYNTVPQDFGPATSGEFPEERSSKEAGFDKGHEDAGDFSPASHHESEKDVEKKRSLSLFERLTGVRRQPTATPTPVDLPSMVETVSVETPTDSGLLEEDDYLEIPAFLRRGDTKR